jgi:Na+-driven multidrug efflux pump
MQLLYGTAFSGAGAALSIHIWTTVVTLQGIVCSYWMVAENLQVLYPARILASLCVCIVLDVLLIPRWGIRGAAAATLTAQFVSSTVFFAFDRRTRLMPLMQLRALFLPFRRRTASAAGGSI